MFGCRSRQKRTRDQVVAQPTAREQMSKATKICAERASSKNELPRNKLTRNY